MKISFLFGAGADYSEKIKIPNGNQFSYMPLFQKDDKLLTALKDFYKNRVGANPDYVGKYIKANVLNKGSVLFKSLMDRCYEDNNKEKEQINYEEKYDYYFNRNIEELSNLPEIQNIQFKGGLEQYFSSICNPRKYGETRFWRLINYYWKCFFMILKPILDYEKTCSYNSILEDFSLIKNLFDDNYLKSFEDDFLYYSKIESYFADYKISGVATTNYTPYVGLYDPDKTIYLSGRLDYFECPENLCIDKVDKLPKDRVIFPYIMTQIPIKPLIAPYQVTQFKRFKNMLDDSEVLIVVGYSMPLNDNHILSFINEFIKNKGTLIYYQHETDEGKKVKLKEKLYYNKNDNIITIEHCDTAMEVYEKINSELEKLKL